MNAGVMTRNARTAAYLRLALENIKEYGSTPAIETAVARAYVLAHGIVNEYDEKAAYEALMFGVLRAERSLVN